MKYCGSLYAIKDRETTINFYNDILGVSVINDFGANFTITGGVSFQTIESWSEFIDRDINDIKFQANSGELYFEVDDINEFIDELSKHNEINYVHRKKEHAWGQIGIRFYDPDYHIIEVSESLESLVKRLFKSGMLINDISTKTMLPIELVEEYINSK